MTNFTGGKLDSNAHAQPLAFDWELRFTQPPTISACAYWRSRCEGRAMPERADLDPAAMRKFSSHVGLIEIRRDEGPDIEYFIRRAGTAWEEVYGNMTRRFIHEFLPPEIELSWRQVFDTVRRKQAPARISTGIDFQNKNWLATEMFVAPLGAADAVNMLFMTFVAWNKHADELPRT